MNAFPITLKVDGKTPADVTEILIFENRPHNIVYASYVIEPDDKFGQLYVKCSNGSEYTISASGKVDIHHGKWRVVSEYNTPLSTKIYYNNQEITGVKSIFWKSDANLDLNDLEISV